MDNETKAELEAIQQAETGTDPACYGRDIDEVGHLIDPQDRDVMIDNNGIVTSFTQYQQQRLLETETTKRIMSNDTYDWLPNLPQLNKDRLQEIEHMAKGLSKTEIKEYFCIDEEFPLTAFEERIFTLAYRKGTARGKREAMEKLFVGMSGRQGAVTALAYLQTHAERFPQEGDTANMKPGQGFSFKVNL